MELKKAYLTAKDRNLKKSYTIPNKNGYHIAEPSSHEQDYYYVLYCKVHNSKIVGAIEVREGIVFKTETPLATFGRFKEVAKHYQINLQTS